MARTFGGDDNIVFSDNANFRDQTQHTFIIWKIQDNVTADHGLYERGDNFGANGDALIADDVDSATSRTNTFTCTVNDGSSSRISGASNSAVASVWQIVGIKFLAGSSTGLELWINGSEDANSPVTTVGRTTNGNSTNPPRLGEMITGSPDLVGKIGGFAFWSGLRLSDTEMAVLARGVNPFVIQNDNLRLFTPVIGNDDPEENYGPNGGTGTISGTIPKYAGNPPVEHLSNYISGYC